MRSFSMRRYSAWRDSPSECPISWASAVQIGTANLINPRAPHEIMKGIKTYLEEKHFNSLQELVGLAKR